MVSHATATAAGFTGSRGGLPDSASGPRLLYSVEEAAELLGIGRTFMFHLIGAGLIDSLKVGKRRKIPRGALDDYIERLRAEQARAGSAPEPS